MTNGFEPNDDPFGTPGQPNRAGGEFDFDIDVKSLELPADGTYMIRVLDVSRGMSQAGQPMLIWDFKIEASGFQFRSWTSLQDNAKWKIMDYTAALGIPTKDGRLAFNRQDVIGKRAIADIVKRMAPNGRDNLNIERIYMPKPDDTAEQFAGPKAQSSDVPF